MVSSQVTRVETALTPPHENPIRLTSQTGSFSSMRSSQYGPMH